MNFFFVRMGDISEHARRMRRNIVQMTTVAGSGHPTSALSAADLMSVLFFHKDKFFKHSGHYPKSSVEDYLIFSKGHASPLFYALWAEAGNIDFEELETFRKFGSRLEGHPTRKFPLTEVPTGSLGQGLAVGVGEALALRQQLTAGSGRLTKKDRLNFLSRVWVLLGDSELAEGSIWEAARIAAHYELGNVLAIVDVNRLGQRGETMDGWHTKKIAQKFKAFGWRVFCVDGHNFSAIARAYGKALASPHVPTAIIAKTVKGKGVSFLENREGWHGKALSQEECNQALREIGKVKEFFNKNAQRKTKTKNNDYREKKVGYANGTRANIGCLRFDELCAQYAVQDFAIGDCISTRSVYGKSLAKVAEENEMIVALDAEVSNSTFAIDFAKAFPERFFEMYIAEQTMVSVATGMARRGYIPFMSTFAAFFARAFDQLRMAQYAGVPLVCVGSHCGVSIGEDGASQMGLEDLAIFRTLLGSVVLYPSDAVSMSACVRLAAEQKRVTYIRSTRAEMSVLYSTKETFRVGGSKTLCESDHDSATIVAAGITVHEAFKAYQTLRKENIAVRVIDVYSVKPIDEEVLRKAAQETGGIIVVEDHYAEGGLADAVREALAEYRTQGIDCRGVRVISLAVRKMPMSGTMEELLRYEEIDAEAIAENVRMFAKDK